MNNITEKDIQNLIIQIGFIFQENFTNMKNESIQLYAMNQKIICFQKSIVMLHNDGELNFLFHIENDYPLVHKKLNTLFKTEIRKSKINILLNG